jgi:hypothetical protein
MFGFMRNKKKQQQINSREMGIEEARLLVNSMNDIRSRIGELISGGYDFADTLHNIYLDFGYPQTLTFSNFWNMYRRFGIAKNVVELPADVTWMRPPEVKSSEAFVKEFDALNERVFFWERLRGLDTRQRVGRYAGMFMRVRDSKDPSDPIEGKLQGSAALMQMVPLYEGQLTVSKTETDPKKDDYGLPTMYQFSGSNPGSRNEQNSGSFQIHPSRIVIAAEGADNGGIYGIPALEGCYNSLMDLRKVIGGGAEGFYKNSAQSIIYDLKDAASAKANKELLEKFNDQSDDFMRNRHRRSQWTPGLEAKVLDSKLVQPKEFFMNALNDVAACSKIAATILIGQQTGRLASNEDSRSFLSMANSRREGFANGMSRDVIDWCINFGVLPAATYELIWDDLLALSKKEQLDNASQMAETNSKQFSSGGEVPFTGDEIREAAGFEPLEDVEPEGEKPAGEEE